MRRAHAGLVVLGLAACARPAGGPAAPAAPSAQAAKSATPERVWSYQVVQTGPDLDVTATFPSGTAETISLEAEATSFVASLTLVGGESRPFDARDGIWTVPACARGCTLHYVFHLADAGRYLRDPDSALTSGGSTEAPPSTWLVRPTDHADGTTYRFHVRATTRFDSGVRPIPNAPDTYGSDADDLDTAPFSIFGDYRARTVTVPGATIQLAILPGKLALDDAAMDRWLDSSARAIDAYYGRFPVPRFLLVVAPQTHGGSDTADGRTLAGGGSSILLGVSGRMTAADIPKDWVLTHEMTHLTLASLPRQHHWLEEGLATYVEPIARAMVGTIPESEVWRGLIEGLPNGEPEAGDEGLDRTHTWGRTYWGGALFSFVADVEIRKRTGNKKSLQDALRGILAAGGSGEARWPLEDALKQGDAATGTTVLTELHAAWGEAPVRVDLAKMWKELGVRMEGKAIAYDDGAPLAEIRKGMTRAAR